MLPWANIGPTTARRRLVEYDELGDNFDRSGDNEAVDMAAYSQEDGRDAGEDFLDEFRPSRFGASPARCYAVTAAGPSLGPFTGWFRPRAGGTLGLLSPEIAEVNDLLRGALRKSLGGVPPHPSVD